MNAVQTPLSYYYTAEHRRTFGIKSIFLRVLEYVREGKTEWAHNALNEGVRFYELSEKDKSALLTVFHSHNKYNHITVEDCYACHGNTNIEDVCKRCDHPGYTTNLKYISIAGTELHASDSFDKSVRFTTQHNGELLTPIHSI